MRLLLKLKTKGSFKYDLSYYHKAQGFIYNLLKDTDYGILHDKKDYKYFCFSNIFPIGDIKDNETRNFLISSPDRVFIKILFDKLSDLSNKKNSINIGEMEFFIDSIDVVNIKLKKKFNLITATPIIIRIPENKYEIYNIPHNFRKKRYVYWRPEYQVKA
ncbi:MAG: hypothetical protein KQA41_01340, partial [Candidatus Aenigmarchaeota archaeon]|nr:hypothetical protein [Candidatus Aenigmarchaeota archaeon]